MGFLGTAYNRTILVALNLTSRFTAIHGTVRAGVIGAFVGAVGWFMPLLIGSGDALTQSTLDGRFTFAALGYGLAVELTGSFSLFLPMLAATFAAVTVASLAKCPPIYESLREAS